MISKIFLSIALLVSGLVIYAAMAPSAMFVSREVVISATPEMIFPYINNSKLVNDWMPWKEMDPNLVMSYSGPTEGVGAKSSWDSDGQMGTGEALVVESVQNQYVKTQLTYTKPFEMSQLATMSLAPVADGTKVTWSVEGQKNFLFRLMGIFFDCDDMIGGEFEKGLATLKRQISGVSE